VQIISHNSEKFKMWEIKLLFCCFWSYNVMAGYKRAYCNYYNCYTVIITRQQYLVWLLLFRSFPYHVFVNLMQPIWSQVGEFWHKEPEIAARTSK